jgi:uncharacterized protein YfaP (DUF2135 family)
MIETELAGQPHYVTQAYGPEMFTLPKAAAGKYQVRVKYFAQDTNRASTRTKVYATIYGASARRRRRSLVRP